MQKCTDFEEIRVGLFDVNVAIFLGELVHSLQEVNIRVPSRNYCFDATLSTLKWLTSSMGNSIRSLEMPYRYLVRFNYGNQQKPTEKDALHFWLNWLHIPRPNGQPKLLSVSNAPVNFMLAFNEAVTKRFAVKATPSSFCVQMTINNANNIRLIPMPDAEINDHLQERLIFFCDANSKLVQFRISCAPVGQQLDGWGWQSAAANKRVLILQVKEFEQVHIAQPEFSGGNGIQRQQEQMDGGGAAVAGRPNNEAAKDCAPLQTTIRQAGTGGSHSNGGDDVVFVDDVIRSKWFAKVGAVKTEPSIEIESAVVDVDSEKELVEGVPIKEEPLAPNAEYVEQNEAPPLKKVKQETAVDGR